MTFPRVYILSPAHCGGVRAQLIQNDRATFDLARRLRSREGATLGEVFAFLSGLYFRGKLAYAEAFGRPPRGVVAGTLVITTNRGLVPPDVRVTIEDIRAMATGDIDPRDEVYRTGLLRDAQRLAATLGSRGRAILLGSIASGKYVDTLLAVLGERLLFPKEFVGRGDMSRGGLMLRCVRAGTPLSYVPVLGAVRHGARPAKLAVPGRASVTSPSAALRTSAGSRRRETSSQGPGRSRPAGRSGR